MKYLLLIVCFVTSLIANNPVADSFHSQRDNNMIGDTIDNYCIHEYDTVKDTCNTLSNECPGCNSCTNSWPSLLLGSIAIILSLITLIDTKKQLNLSNQQVKNSNQQAESSNALAIESYNTFKIESERQYQMQQETLKAIVKQTDKLHSTKQKAEIVNHFSGCYSLLEMIFDYLLKHFGDIVRDTMEYNTFVFDILSLVVKDANAIQMLMAEQKEGNEEFLNALVVCSGLTSLQIHNQKDMDDLMERLALCKKAFENKKNDIDKEIEGK